ncbi:hypothetical protein E3P99_03295 [Wallemia hederae]|uniref:SRB8 ARM-like domain-containing protein n=1 Tax=Wallemia hederae TaxID=1540922 RepID=A0A4T0FGG5_9BASI|nr:hypothetical protein E3P99_03295 [Wallemia hederae]
MNNLDKLEIYTQKPPSWRLPISSTSLEYPDFQPPQPGKDEDVVNLTTMRNGYTAQPAVQNETFSCHQLIVDSLQTNAVAQNLEFIFKSALDNRHTRNHPQSNYIKASGTEDPHTYFAHLASLEISLQSLLKLPRNLNPPVILDLLQQHHVDSRRAVWFVKLLSRHDGGVKKIHGQKLSVEWTNILTDRLSRKLVELPTPDTSLDGFDSTVWLSQFSFLLDILRAFIVNGLLDNLILHMWLLDHLKHIHLARLPLVATLVLENIDGFYSSHHLGNELVAAACHRIEELRRAHASEHLGALRESLQHVIHLTLLHAPHAFISPSVWERFSSLIETVVGTQPSFAVIKARNTMLLHGSKDASRFQPYSSPRQSLMRDIDILDSITTYTNIRAIALSYFEVGKIETDKSAEKGNDKSASKTPQHPYKEKINTLLDWAVSDSRTSSHRCYAVATLLRFFVALQVKQKAATKEVIKRHMQETIFEWLNGTAGGDTPSKLLGELVRRRVFSYSTYVQHIIASGLLNSPHHPAKKALHTSLLLNTPLFDASLSVVNLRRMVVDRDVGAANEKMLDSLARTFRALLPRLHKKTESIPAITTLDLYNSFGTYKTMPLFYQYRAIHTYLLPAVHSFVDAETHESKISVEELATVVGIIEYFEDYASLHALIVTLLPIVSDRQVLFLLMDAIRRSWTVLVCLNAMEKLLRCVFDKYTAMLSSGGQVRPLVLLLVSARDNMQLPADLQVPTLEAVSALEHSLTTSMSMAPTSPPSSIPDVQRLLNDPSPAKAADLATTLWFRHSSNPRWGASAWAGVLDALKGGSGCLSGTPSQLQQLVSCLSVFLHEVNNRFPDGLERHITASLVNHSDNLLCGEMSCIMKSLVVQMVVRRVVQTTSVIEEVYLPLTQAEIGCDDEVLVNLNYILLAVLAPEQKAPMALSDYQRLLTRRGRAYRPPHLAALAQVLAVLVATEVGEREKSVKISCQQLRESLIAQTAFTAACMRDIDIVYDVLMAQSEHHVPSQDHTIDTLKTLTHCEDTPMHIDDLTNEDANPWTFARQKIVLRLMLNYGGKSADNDTLSISDLVQRVQSRDSARVKDMLRGINGSAGTELANICFGKIEQQLLSLKSAIEAGSADDSDSPEEVHLAKEIAEGVDTIADVLLSHKTTLPPFDEAVLSNIVANVVACINAICTPSEEDALENGEVVEEGEVRGDAIAKHVDAFKVLCQLVQLLLRTTPETVQTQTQSTLTGLATSVFPNLLRHLVASADDLTYDTVVGVLERLPQPAQKAWKEAEEEVLGSVEGVDKVDVESDTVDLPMMSTTPSDVSTGVIGIQLIRHLLPTRTSHSPANLGAWDLLDQIPESDNGDRRIQFNAPQLHKHIDARLVNDHLLHANPHIPLEHERNVPGDGLESGPVLAYQYRRGLRTQDLTMSVDSSLDDESDYDEAEAEEAVVAENAAINNTKKRKAEADHTLTNGTAAAATTATAATGVEWGVNGGVVYPSTTTTTRRTSNRRRK